MFKLRSGWRERRCHVYSIDAERLISKMGLAGFEPSSIADARQFAMQTEPELAWAAEIAFRSVRRDRECAQRASARRWVASDVADMRPQQRCVTAHRQAARQWCEGIAQNRAALPGEFLAWKSGGPD